MAVLNVMKKQIDLDEVKGMDDEEYDSLIRYVQQWDKPEWTNTVRAARGEDVADDAPQVELDEPKEDEDPLEAMTVEELKAELALKDLPLSGHKADLIERLREAGGVEE